jgi:succinate-semialdehyde dehydrogenase/glutarate-semialdehyde dehydrogenase
MELGGSDPFIVLQDANIDEAVSSAVSGRMQMNAGQSCIAAKRFIVHSSLISEFTKKLQVKVESLVVGDPTDPKTEVGPLANQQMIDDIDKQIRASIDQGAKLVTGGKKLEVNGCFYQPTILSGVTKDMVVFKEEVFGPVLPIISFETNEEAITLANDCLYGLGATIFTQDIKLAEELASKIEAGSVFINNQVKSDSRLPFGGVKKSGYGRELSDYGIREFVNIKTVYIK